MKKFWIVLLSMGLLAAFSIPAFAIDVKFSGEYRVRGWYDNNPTGFDKDTIAAGNALMGYVPGSYADWNGLAAGLAPGKVGVGPNAQATPIYLRKKNAGSADFYDQRLRIQTDFVVAEGLTLTTRFDALEKKWGDKTYGAGRSAAALNAPGSADSSGRVEAAGTAEQSNIEFERAYVTFKSPIGLWIVGYQQFMAFGPDPGNSSTTRPGIKYVLPIGNLMLIAAIEKGNESDVAGDIGRWSDADQDIYDLGVVYKLGKMGDAGVIFQYAVDNSGRAYGVGIPAALGYGTDNGFRQKLLIADPYVRLNFGPVLVEFEGMYVNGKLEWDNRAKMGAAAALLPGYVGRAGAAKKDADIKEYGGFLHVRADLSPVYFGLYAGYAQGDDITTANKVEGGMVAALKGGSDFKPCLMLFNDDYATQFSGATGVASLGSYMDNVKFGQLYVGAKPTPKLDIKASYSYAEADERAIANQKKDYGHEIDVTAAYKIYDNLEYMVGGAYFMTGDWFKRGVVGAKVDDDYMLMHRLTLKF